MKKALLTSVAAAALAASQIGFAACVESKDGANTTSASCESTVTLKLDRLVVLKGLDDYDFSNPGAAGWGGTSDAADIAAIDGNFCVGTNDPTDSVILTVSSANNFAVQRASGGPPVSYNAYLAGSTTRLSNSSGSGLVFNGATVDDLICDDEAIALNVQFTGAALAAAAVGTEAYTDTITVTVAPN
jgi:hypothetical protein